jgi:HTH-type transcriptional regulator / antitoxin HigA
LNMETLKYKVIKTKPQYKLYCDMLEELVFNNKKTKEMKEKIELLTLLIEKWDNEHNTLSSLDPVELLEYLMKENKISQIELAKFLGVSKGLVSEILSYKKGMSKEIIRKLASKFKLSQEAFNKEYKFKAEYAVV